MSRFTLALLILLQSTSLAAETLTLLFWEDALAPEVISRWQQQTGVNIQQIYIDSDEQRDKLLSQNKLTAIDIAVLDSASTARFANAGTLAPLEKQAIPNARHINARWQAACGDDSVAYFWGSLGLIYRSDKLNFTPDSWLDIVQAKDDVRGHIGMIDNKIETLLPALLANGFAIDSEQTNELTLAYQTLKNMPILTFDYPLTFVQSDPRAEDLHIAMAYSGDQYSLNGLIKTANVWQYVVPKEGSLLWVDCLTVLSSSKNKARAKQFINFLNQPEIAKINALKVAVATPNDAALALLPDSFTTNKSIFPAADILDKSKLNVDISVESALTRSRIINTLKKQHELK
jgi:spermidine/putrescine transport system substrate-binding protein